MSKPSENEGGIPELSPQNLLALRPLIAAAVMVGFAANPHEDVVGTSAESMAKLAVAQADALIKELSK